MPDNPINNRNRRAANADFFSIDIDADRMAEIANNAAINQARMVQQQQEAIARIRNRHPRNNVGQVLDTVGIELESIALTKNKVSVVLDNLPEEFRENFKVHRDGSSEIKAYFINVADDRNGLIVNAHTKEAIDLFEGNKSKDVVGYELISVPMDIDTAEMTLWTLLPALERNGDFLSERCATHIHVGGMKNLGFLKNSLKLGLWFDEVFYSLAHMDGEKFRGYSNNAIYARPLINGPYFRYDRYYYQILNWENALEAKDMYEFFACYGANVNGEMQKYHPGRYFSINLYSIPRIGTVEFRHFNQSFNPAITSAITKLCQVFVEISMKVNNRILKKLEPGDVFKVNNAGYYIEKLYKFLDIANSLDCTYSLEKEDVHELEKVIYRYKGIGIENKEVLTHCKDFEVSNDLIETGELKRSTDKPCPDGHTDIHNIKYQSIIK